MSLHANHLEAFETELARIERLLEKHKKAGNFDRYRELVERRDAIRFAINVISK